MKKLILFAVAGMLAFTACGPSAEEIAKKEQATKDSIAAAQAAIEQAKADSIAKVEEEMKAKAAELEKMKQDSIAKAEEETKAKKGTKSAKMAPKKEEVKQAPVGGGRR